MKVLLRRAVVVLASALALVAAAPSDAGAQTVAPRPAGAPTGAFDAILRVPGGIRVVGWALDPDSPASIDVHVYAGTVGVGRLPATLPRSDVGASFPGHGEAHGFDGTVAVGPGTYNICVYGIGTGPGGNSVLGCRAFTVDSSAIGALDAVTRSPGALHLTGWALDLDTSLPTSVHIHDNGVPVSSVAADLPRGDIAASRPGYGDRHGFDVRIAAHAGEHEICAFAISVGAGPPSTRIGCKRVSVVSAPEGLLEPLSLVPGGVRVTGWALDRDTDQPITVHVYADGVPVATSLAGDVRPGVVVPFPDFGDAHFFDLQLPLAVGRHTVCVYGIDALGGSSNALIGCQTFTMTGTPFGAFESIGRAPGGVRVRGWAIDPDTSGPVQIHAYAGTTAIATFSAEHERTDIARTFPQFGAFHGFDAILSLPAGATNVCLYAIDNAGGPSTLLSCGPVSSDSGIRGVLDTARAVAGGVRVNGWALDLDVVEPIDVHVYANGNFVGAVTANASRPDVAALFPGQGDLHGFDASLPLAPGNYRICVYAINVAAGSGNPTLACRDVSLT